MARAQWGPDIKLSTNEGSAGLNENMGRCLIAAGDAVHVVWCDFTNSSQAIYYKRSLDGGLTWGADTRLSGTPSADSFPLLALSGPNLHLVFFRSNGMAQAASFYKRSTDGGSTWDPEVFLGTTKWWPGVAAAGSNVYVSLNTVIDGTNSEVFFRRSIDNGTTWEAQQQISHAVGRSEDPAIRASGSYIHLAWNDNRDGNMAVYYRRSTDQGVTWGPETALTHAPAFTYTPTVYATGSDVDVAYADRQSGVYNIYHLHSADFGATWGAPEQLTQTTTGNLYPSIVRDDLNVHLVWGYGVSGGALQYLHSGNGGASWMPTVSLVSGSTPTSAFIAVAGAIVHLIWRDMRDGHGAIYYKRNPTGNQSTRPNITGFLPNGQPG
jgi:hypothetical protein